jgi:glucosamine--fructose-6-phosphate aminotransferase (isomerizing)
VTTALRAAIEAQPAELARLARLPVDDAAARLDACRRLWVVGTGSSEHAALLGAGLLREAGRDARGVSSLDLARWLPSPQPGDGVIVLSHTGESALAQAAAERARSAGVPLVAITGRGVGWPEALETVEREQAETYTVSYTGAVVVLARLAAELGAAMVGEELDGLAARVRVAIADPGIDAITEPGRVLVYAGVGPGAVTAREAAIKAREAARVLSEGYDAEYLLHGSAVPLDGRDRLVLIDPDGDPTALLGGVGRAAEAAGLAVSSLPGDPELHPLLRQIPLTARVQLAALALAESRGEDPDTVITGPWAEKTLWRLGAPAD